ncbi:hypothetical protein PMAYCL1PPCAC_09683, partial [Pristionchus mayeri]
SLPSPPPLVGPLSPNDFLTKIDRVLEGEIIGPESIVVDGEKVYTGLADGRIIQIVGGRITKTIKLVDDKRPADGSEDEEKFGRPLGMRQLSDEKIVVVDAFLGVFIVDFETESKRIVFDAKTPLKGAEARFLNDIDVISDDEVLFTDSSLLYSRKDSMKEIVGARGTGRVISLRISTGEAKVLMSGLHFANGIQVLPDRESLIVAEMTRSRIMRYYFGGVKEGTFEEFCSNLPGMPDNLRLSHNENSVWVS